MKRLFILATAIVATQSHAIQIEPIVVSSKQDLKNSEVLSSTEVYEVSSMDDHANARVADLLGNISGVEIVKSGLMGGPAGVFIRGQESRHTLILVDGKRLYDPTDLNRNMNLNVLNTSEIERVEVLKGSQSVLYGSDAIGGVINIITKKAGAKDSVKISGGYYSEIAASKSVVFGDSALKISAHNQTTNFDSEAKNGTEKDESENKGFDFKFSQDIAGGEFEAYYKYAKNFSQVDRFDFSSNEVVDDNEANNQDIVNSFGFDYKTELNSKTSLVVEFQNSSYDRSIKYYDTFALEYVTEDYEGSLSELEIRSKIKTVTGHMILGAQSVGESYKSDGVGSEEILLNDIFMNQYFEDRINFYEAGARITTNEDFGSHLIYNFAFGKNLNKENQIKLGHKTGYKAPSVYQLKAPASGFGPIGNENVGPEKSSSFEASYLFNNKKDLSFDATIFYNEVSNFIGFEYGTGYINTDGVIYRGVEIAGTYQFLNYSLNSDLTLLNITQSDGQEAQNRPDFAYNLSGSYKINDNQSIGVKWAWRGRRFEVSNGETFRLNPYDTFDVNYSFVKNNIEIMASITNIFDRDYEVRRGYSVLRRALELGAKYSF